MMEMTIQGESLLYEHFSQITGRTGRDKAFLSYRARCVASGYDNVADFIRNDRLGC